MTEDIPVVHDESIAVPEPRHALDIIREKIANKKEPKETEPSVEKVKLQLEAINKLADNTNEVFSELSIQETLDVSKALAFADDPLPDINHKLKVAGIKDDDGTDFQIKLPVLENFITLQKKHRHSTDRMRVEEFIRALKAMNQPMYQDDDKKPGLFGGIRSRLI